MRLGTDDQLIALYRKGYDEAFDAIHDRYRVRLFAYTRRLLGPSNADAEDALQEVFMRASTSLRNDDRQIVLLPWLYRVAHNYCVDQIRRPEPELCELHEVSRPPHRDPAVEAELNERIRLVVSDIGQLPDQQRSAIVMREFEGMHYTEIADALAVSEPAVKSAMNRARGSLKATKAARDAVCADIQADLERAHGRKVRMSGRARKHLRHCAACRTYKDVLRHPDRTLNSLGPGLPKLVGIGGAAGGGAAVGGGSAAGTTISVGAGPITAKLAVVVCCAALVGGGADKLRPDAAQPPHAPVHAHKRARPAPSRQNSGGIAYVDPRGPSQAGPVRATRLYPTVRAPKVAPSSPALVSPSAYAKIVPKRGTMTTHRAGSSAPTNYSSTADAARQTGGAAGPDDGPATTTDPPVRDEPTPNGAPADRDSGSAPPEQMAPVAPETHPKPPPAEPAPASPTPVAATGATPSAPAPTTPSESGGGTGASTAATSAPAAP